MISRSFEEISSEHISGRWRVKSSTLPSHVQSFPLAAAEAHQFHEDGAYTLSGSAPTAGRWYMERNEEIIPNPIIYFEISGLQLVESAMITRFAYMPYGSSKPDEMILYFSNGCEIVLEKLSDTHSTKTQ